MAGRVFQRRSHGDLVDPQDINELQEALEIDDGRLDGKAGLVHDHDERYYTETEVGGFLELKADVGHKHPVTDLTINNGFRIDNGASTLVVGHETKNNGLAVTSSSATMRSGLGAGTNYVSVTDSGTSSGKNVSIFESTPTLNWHATRKDYVDAGLATKKANKLSDAISFVQSINNHDMTLSNSPDNLPLITKEVIVSPNTEYIIQASCSVYVNVAGTSSSGSAICPTTYFQVTGGSYQRQWRSVTGWQKLDGWDWHQFQSTQKVTTGSDGKITVGYSCFVAGASFTAKQLWAINGTAVVIPV